MTTLGWVRRSGSERSGPGRIGPTSTRRAAAGAAVGALALIALDGGITYRAQQAGLAWAADQGFYGGPLYSATGHVLAMLLLAGFALAITTMTARNGNRPLAFVVLATVAAGPMTLVAAPVSASLVRADSGDTRLWWHLLIGAAQFSILAAVQWWFTRSFPASDRTRQNPPRPSDLVPFVAIATLAIVVEILVQPFVLGRYPAPAAVVGWAFLTAATTLVVRRSDRAGAAFTAAGGAGLVLTVMSLAYLRDGGWPGVAGWEFMGMESPIVLSIPSGLMLLLTPVTGIAVRRIAVRAEQSRIKPLAPA